ncbi:MAG: LemA family protein [Armatimonadetes bacterium]|nr:LemA family protein [Armatimonadota bacterium]
MGTALVVIAGLIVLIVIWIIASYNRLVSLKNRIDNAWAQIDVQLKRRYDLIPNLVETVKGYASHEKEVFEKVAAARSAMMQAEGVESQAQAQNQITQALKSLFAVAEAYPELKANENFMELQQELSNTENKIATSREIYNDIVASFNTMIQSFPSSLISSSFGFRPREYFPMEDTARETPKVSF